MTVAPEPPVVGVGALLLKSNGTFLIGYRTKRGETESWCLPGGHVEPGESFERAALREIAEEAGIHAVVSPQVFAVVLDLKTERTLVTAGVSARISADDALPSLLEPEIFSCWRWASLDDPPRPLYPASDSLIAAWKGSEQPTGWVAYAFGRARHRLGGSVP